MRLVDERLTTVSAQRDLHQAGRTQRSSRAVIDQAAAVVLLQDALDTERSTGRPPGELGPRRGDVLMRRGVSGCMVLVVVLVLGVGGVLFLRDRFTGPADYRGSGGDAVTVQVHPGDTATAIGGTLHDAGVVASVGAFVQAADDNADSVGIQPGYYSLPTKISGADAVLALLDPASKVQNTVTIPEGLRVDQTVDLLVQGTGVSRDAFDHVLAHPDGLGLPPYARGNPEGFLFPATYDFPPDATATEILRTMVQRFDQAAAEIRLVPSAAKVNLSPRDAVIVASIVQAEVAQADFAKAARVIYNRLNQGIKLQMDSTVNFALKSSDLTLTNQQIGVDSPYNTYKYAGLPPGPINSPGQAALEAALAPAAGDWLYFIAQAPGSTVTRFTSSYQQFLQWKTEFYAQSP